jgi:dipeptidyl aminopeptidase/acylaminoacyl peptidase
MLDYEQLLRVPYVDPYSGFDISPDGRKIVFAWNLTGQWEIYLLDLLDLGEPRQISSGEGAKFGPRFSPDGTLVMYALDRDGSERFDLFMGNLENGKQVNLTPDTSESILPNTAWSANGGRIAFISNRSGKFCTYVQAVDVSNGVRLLGEPMLIFEGPGHNIDLDWSQDGEWLAIESESEGQDHSVHIVKAADDSAADEARMTRMLSFEGESLNARHARWSPDGKRLVFSCSRGENYELGIYEPSSDQITWLGPSGQDDGEPDWSPDGKRLTYVRSDGPQTWLAIHPLDQPKPALYQMEPGLHFGPAFSPDGKRVMFVFDSPRRPDDLWQLDLETKYFKALTHSLPDDICPDEMVMPSHIRYPSLDGRSVPALIYLPSQDGIPIDSKPPAVVVIHGGPNWLFQYLWYPLMTHLASRGWIVLAPNYRGSTGYGRDWQLANRFEMGRGDTMDVAAGAEYLVREGLADPDRIMVTGRSHGGFLTMSCLTRYPDLWRAGSAVVPFLNWFTSHEKSRQDLQHWDVENMGDPVENAALWRERSPFFHLDSIQAPVQLICGANDPRCPASESSQAYQALQELGKEVDYLIYPDEGHTFLKIENIVEHELRRVEFLARALEKP